MSTVQEDVVAALAGVTGGRIYPLTRPQGATLPCVTYQRVSGQSVQSHSGASGQARSRFQFDVWGRTYDDVAAAGDALRVALIGLRGALGVLQLNDHDEADPLTGMVRRSLDFAIWHAEVVPA